MRIDALPGLVAAALWALPTAVLTTVSPALAAPFVVAGLLSVRLRRGRGRLAGLAALPACLAALRPPEPPPPVLHPGPVHVRGVVHAVVRAPELDALDVRLGTGAAAVRLALDGELEVLPGDTLRILAHVPPPGAPGLPVRLQAVAATAAVTPGPWSLARAAAAARRSLERELLERLPPRDGAMLASLVLGRGTRTDGDLVAAHRATGLSHLLAVSGAHAAMLAFLLGLGSWQGRRRVGVGRARTCIVLALLVAYAAITGNEPPVLRAVASYALAAAATHLGRPCGVVPLLVAPALLTAFLQPQALLGPSFLLSYAAVVGLVLAGPPRGDGFAARWLAAPLRASAWAALLTAPLTAWFFGQLAPWTVVLTPLLAPLVGLMLLLGLATALAGTLVPWCADLLAPPLGALARAYAACVVAADGLPATPVPTPFAPPGFAMLLAGLAAAGLVLARRTRAAWAGAAALLIAPHFVPLVPAGPPRLVLFAVGHGQACLVADGAGHQCALDCGSLQQPFLAAERIVGALTHRALDLLVVTHADQDHHNGVPGLLARVPITEAVLPRALADGELAKELQRAGTRVHLLAPGTSLAPAPHLLVRAPPLPPQASDNDQSLWLSVRLGGTTVLASGDAQELGVAAALAAGIAAPHDVLVLPHHGRANTNAPHLLQRVRPRACLASAASADGETRLGALVRHTGAELWVTGVHGTLHLHGDPPRVHGDLAGRPLAPRAPPGR